MLIINPARIWARARSQFFLCNGFTGAMQFFYNDRQELSNVLFSGGGMDAEYACIGKTPVERIDGITQAPILAHFLEQPGGHAASKNA